MVAGVDHVGLDNQVFADEVGWIKIVGQNAADFGRGEEDMVRTFLLEEAAHGNRVGKVELSA